MRSRSRAYKKTPGPSKPNVVPQEQDCYEGERLALLLESIQGSIETGRALDGNALPERIWFRQQFAIGINEVTRLLERMPQSSERGGSSEKPNVNCGSKKESKLQTVLIASDCNPRWLIRHLPSLASSRKVPLIFIKDKKQGSLRLGELVKLKTALAVGIKAKGNATNQIVEQILCSSDPNHERESPKEEEIPGEP